MRKRMTQFLDLLELNWKKCPWIREQSPEFMLSELEKEVEEVRAELKSGDKKKLEHELGDIGWDYFNLLVLAERKKGVKMKDVFLGLMKKVRHRKPYLFKKGKVSTDEAVKIWKKQKKKE
ncbi:MAG: MazG nucleotide pyrophosphohydrolase domain-containing protein [Candidatus ainarchaeum sp.]|nr:MazG nucleotide pyrophosphohydrolase domain-containing protein [Candidatus ainarchaeum sp.]